MAPLNRIPEQPAITGQGPGANQRPVKIFIVAGEHSGDALGGKLMEALAAKIDGKVEFAGVGGDTMERAGLSSLFPLADVAVMGLMSILARLPRIARRIFHTVDCALDWNPDIVVIIDSPEFTHPIAHRIRQRAPSIPIINYVSPSIWAWRSGRARKMLPYVDHVLALLPFEPDAHTRFGGPPCTYVGHPLVERRQWMETLDADALRHRLGIAADKKLLTVLPGSRASEASRLLGPFGQAIKILADRGNAFDVVIPAVKHLRPIIEQHTRTWPVTTHLVDTDDDKFRAFKASSAALAASGTVTLELALSGTPAVVAYKVDPFAARLRFLLNVPSVVLANLVLAENVYPEYLQEECTPAALAPAVETLLNDTPERAAQVRALSRVPTVMAFQGTSPSDDAALIVRTYLKYGRDGHKFLPK